MCSFRSPITRSVLVARISAALFLGTDPRKIPGEGSSVNEFVRAQSALARKAISSEAEGRGGQKYFREHREGRSVRDLETKDSAVQIQ
jgi:hypothetical protein